MTGGSVGRRALNGMVIIQPIAIAPAIKHKILRYFNLENGVLTRRRDLTGGCCWLRRRGCIWRRRFSTCILRGVVSNSLVQFIIGRRLNHKAVVSAALEEDRLGPLASKFYASVGRIDAFNNGKNFRIALS